MPTPRSVSVCVPATTANIGPGFDCLGAALTLYNTLEFSIADGDGLTVTVSGLDADGVPADASNLAYTSFVTLYEAIAQPVPPVTLTITLAIPLARGLGSSATAIVGGLLGANALAGMPLTQREIMELAIAIEGHPDNVVPALLGGCQLTTTSATSAPDNRYLVCEIPWHSAIVPVVAIPAFELSTSEARRVLPPQYDRADAIFNTAHLGLLIRALESGDGAWLATALEDRIHQPYRAPLIPGFDAVKTAAIDAGAYGVVISGAGPTLLALVEMSAAAVVGDAMVTAWMQSGISAAASIQTIAKEGAIATLLD